MVIIGLIKIPIYKYILFIILPYKLNLLFDIISIDIIILIFLYH
jgi:hypothetical protein